MTIQPSTQGREQGADSGQGAGGRNNTKGSDIKSQEHNFYRKQEEGKINPKKMESLIIN